LNDKKTAAVIAKVQKIETNKTYKRRAMKVANRRLNYVETFLIRASLLNRQDRKQLKDGSSKLKKMLGDMA
jgi:hypothetical protein